ncbi:MAG: tyrosine-type recombinase/integrase [Lachnospiraceae bacterium]|nr:tyrosine-type recombinase/integrase [Lachnospiraceae bacterium]
MGVTYPIRNKDELDAFKKYYLCRKKWRNYLLIIMGLNTALRISDLLNLQWIDVYDYRKHCYRKHICLTEQKTGKSNQIAINNALKQALEYCRNNQSPDSYLFCVSNDETHPISRCQAWRIIKKAAVDTGLDEHISCHSMRKTFGYHAWKQGVPPAMLMNIYNHSSYQITKRYLGIEQEDKDDVFRKIMI